MIAKVKTMEKLSLGIQAMCDRLAMEFQDGWVVTLGAGIATQVSNFDFKDKTIIFHSENGVLGYGPLASDGKEDINLTNASNECVTLLPLTAIVHHADSFALIRGGYVDAVVMGAYEVAENGDLANYKITGRRGGGIGGAMDLAVNAKQVFIAMEHTTRKGQPRLRKRCELPLTAAGVVNLVVTNLGAFEVTDEGFVLKEIAPGYTPEEIQAETEARLIIADDLKEFQAVT